MRRDTDAVALDLVGDRAIATGHRIVRVEHDLAGERFAVIFPDLRQGAVRHGQEGHVAKPNRLIDGAGLCKRAKARNQVLQFLRMT